MARPQDESKRLEILNSAKRLFSSQGFHNTSIADLKEATGLPVGTIYTYFSGKEELMISIVESGWQDLQTRMHADVQAAKDVPDRINVLSRFFFEDLVADRELINILLTEAIELTGINHKLDLLMRMVANLQEEARSQGWLGPEPSNQAQDRAAVVVYFMGLLHAARLSPHGELGFTLVDIQNFLRQTVLRSLGSNQG